MNRNSSPLFKDECEVIGSGGEVKLIKRLDGKLKLKGGSKEESGDAMEWMSLFIPEVVSVATLYRNSALDRCHAWSNWLNAPPD